MNLVEDRAVLLASLDVAFEHAQLVKPIEGEQVRFDFGMLNLTSDTNTWSLSYPFKRTDKYWKRKHWAFIYQVIQCQYEEY